MVLASSRRMFPATVEWTFFIVDSFIGSRRESINFGDFELLRHFSAQHYEWGHIRPRLYNDSGALRQIQGSDLPLYLIVCEAGCFDLLHVTRINVRMLARDMLLCRNTILIKIDQQFEESMIVVVIRQHDLYTYGAKAAFGGSWRFGRTIDAALEISSGVRGSSGKGMVD
ncbi:hypothetical protein KC360_g64 [Hortaea werneckii]|nr:hypothetical protein KC360_g64 [Hortaea werneckii]